MESITGPAAVLIVDVTDVNDDVMLLVVTSPLGQTGGGGLFSLAIIMAPTDSQEDMHRPTINPTMAPWKYKTDLSKSVWVFMVEQRNVAARASS